MIGGPFACRILPAAPRPRGGRGGEGGANCLFVNDLLKFFSKKLLKNKQTEKKSAGT